MASERADGRTGAVTGEAGGPRDVVGLGGKHRRSPDVTGFAVILLVTNQAAVSVDGGDFPVTTPPEEMCVVFRLLS